MSAEIVLKHASVDLAFINTLTQHIADANVFNVFGLNGYLSIRGIRIYNC